MHLLKRALLALMLAVTGVVAAQAGPAYYQPTTNITALPAYGTSSPYVVHAFVSSITYNGQPGAGSYTWAGSCPSTPDGITYVVATGISGCWVLEGFAPFNGNLAFVNVAQAYSKSQRGVPATLTLSGSTSTPNFDNAQNFTLLLVHGTCAPCTFANPSTTLVPGQAGIIKIIQSATGGDTLTWGSAYITTGGVATIALTPTAGARDYFSYYVDGIGNIVLSSGVLNATH